VLFGFLKLNFNPSDLGYLLQLPQEPIHLQRPFQDSSSVAAVDRPGTAVDTVEHIVEDTAEDIVEHIVEDIAVELDNTLSVQVLQRRCSLGYIVQEVLLVQHIVQELVSAEVRAHRSSRFPSLFLL
jgi:hypothetical protein